MSSADGSCSGKLASAGRLLEWRSATESVRWKDEKLPKDKTRSASVIADHVLMHLFRVWKSRVGGQSGFSRVRGTFFKLKTCSVFNGERKIIFWSRLNRQSHIWCRLSWLYRSLSTTWFTWDRSVNYVSCLTQQMTTLSLVDVFKERSHGFMGRGVI